MSEEIETEEEILEGEELHYSLNQEKFINDIMGYILNKNKKYKEARNFTIPLYNIIAGAIDICTTAHYYCLSRVNDNKKFELRPYSEKEYKKGIKELKELFKDFKIIENGNKFSCSAEINLDHYTSLYKI